MEYILVWVKVTKGRLEWFDIIMHDNGIFPKNDPALVIYCQFELTIDQLTINVSQQ